MVRCSTCPAGPSTLQAGPGLRRAAHPGPASPMPPPMSSPIRWPRSTPGSTARSTGTHDRLPRAPVVARLRRGRGDGHRAARHGPRLADLARADPPLLRRRQGSAGASIAGGCRHRPPRAGARCDGRRRDRAPTRSSARRSRRPASRMILMASRALAVAAKGPDDYVRVYDRVLVRPVAAGDPALAGRDVRPGAGGLLGQRRPHGGDGYRRSA